MNSTSKSPFAIDVDKIAADAPKEKKVIPEVVAPVVKPGHHIALSKTHIMFFVGLALVSFAVVYFLSGNGENLKSQLKLDDTIPEATPTIEASASPAATNGNTNSAAAATNSNQNTAKNANTNATGNQNTNSALRPAATNGNTNTNSGVNANANKNGNTNVNRAVLGVSPSPSFIPVPSPTLKSAAMDEAATTNTTPSPTVYPSPTPIPEADKPKSAQSGPMAWAIVPAVMVMMWRLVRRREGY